MLTITTVMEGGSYCLQESPVHGRKEGTACSGLWWRKESTPPYWMDVEQPAGEAAEGHLEHLGGGGSQGTHQGGLALVDVG